MDSVLAGKVALVTGAARGIGAAIARRLHAAGADVMLTDVLVDEGRALAAELGSRAAFVEHDVGDEAAWEEAVESTRVRFGRLDALVNNAGVYEPGTIADMSVETFDRMVRINQLGVFLGMKHALEPLKAGDAPAIVNISSIAGLLGFPEACAYVGTKWAVRGMTKTAAVEFAPHRIRVNSIHPGFIDTPMLDKNSAEANAAGVEATPLKRVGKPDDIADAVLFLVGPGSGFVTGAELTVDGGWVL